MSKKNIFEDIIKCFTDAIPPSLQEAKKDLEKNFRAVLTNGFSRLDLVTREEFDAQMKVLGRTRNKVEALEAELKILEIKLRYHDEEMAKRH